MQPDNTLSTFEDLQVTPYDLAASELQVPSALPTDEPLILHELNAEWWAYIRGMSTRLLYADAWEGTSEVKADNAQYALQAIDLLQKPPANILEGYRWDWPVYINNPTTYLILRAGVYNPVPNYYREQLFTGTQYRIWLDFPQGLLIKRIELDTSWDAVAGCTLSDWILADNGTAFYTQNLTCGGNQTLVYNFPGVTPEQQVTYISKLQLLQRLTVNNPSLPYLIQWTGIRVYGYGTKPTGSQ